MRPRVKKNGGEPMKKLLNLFFLLMPLAMCLPAPAQNIFTPSWLRYLGNGVGGNFSCTSGVCPLGDERWMASFNVSPGATVVSKANNGPFIIRSTGTCTIAGAVSNSANTGNGGGVLNKGDIAGAGGGGGGGTNAGTAGLNGVADQQLPVIFGGGGGAAAAGNGGNGGSPGPSQYHVLIGAGSQWPIGGATGGSGGGNGSGTTGGAGGVGGGAVIFICQSINFTGMIDASGGPGQNSPANNTGAGGGGGGGYVILSAASFINNTGTINVSGGTGGTCGTNTGCGAGGNGGNGWTYFQTIR
jgi:hypothetical protein